MGEKGRVIIKTKVSSSMDDLLDESSLKPRSASLSNIEAYGKSSPQISPKTDRHHLNLLSSSPLKGIRKRLTAFKLSKSNSDISSHTNQDFIDKKPHHDGKRLLPYAPNHVNLESKSPRETRKSLHKDEMKKKKSQGENNNFQYVNEFSGGGTRHMSGVDRTSSINSDTLSITSTRERKRASQDSTDQYVVVETLVYDDPQDSPSETDEVDGFQTSEEHSIQEIERLVKKIKKTKEELMEMQNTKDEYLTNFLKSAENTTENSKTKTNFEKNNLKTNTSIHLLQKKLEKYESQLKEIEEYGIHGPKRLIRAVQDSVRSGASSLTGAVSKPLGSLNNFMKEKKGSDKKHCSSDNVAIHVIQNDDEHDRSGNNGSDEDSSGLSMNAMGSGNQSDVDCAEQHQNIIQMNLQNEQFEIMKKGNEELKENYLKLKDGMVELEKSVQQERYKNEQLTTELTDMYHQWNDLTELHQNEMSGLKQEMDQTLERIECMEYRFAERSGDIEEAVGTCETRITKMELQQQQQQQLLLSVDGYFDAGSNTKLLLSKLLSLILSIFTFALLVVSTFSKLSLPFISTRNRVICTSIAIIAIIFTHYSTDRGLTIIIDVLNYVFRPLFNRLPNRTNSHTSEHESCDVR